MKGGTARMTLRAILVPFLVLAVSVTAHAEGLWCVVSFNPLTPSGDPAGFIKATECYALTDAQADNLPRDGAGEISLAGRSRDTSRPGHVDFTCFKKQED